MNKDFSPEEKLLRLIKGSKKKVAPREEESAPKIQPSESMPQPDKMPAHRKKSEPKGAKSVSISLPLKLLKGINTRHLNSILIIALAALLAYFIYDFSYAAYYKGEEPKVSAEDETKAPEVKKEDVIEEKPYSFYSSSIKDRNIFMPQYVETEPVITGPTTEEISAGLSLIGIIAGDRPQAIIEDKKSGKSHFLYKGGSIGEAKVVDVLDDSVVMEYKGKKFELVL